MEATELSVPLSWGNIAVKAWGNTSDFPVLAVHGYQDNAAAFDNLVPLLAKGFYFVCIDLPGHGQSSHYPKGICFSYVDFVFDIIHIVQFFQWSKFSIIAHSLGSNFALYFAAIFPPYVSRIIIIDLFSAYIIPDEIFVVERCQRIMDKLLYWEKQRDCKNIYTLQEALMKVHEYRYTDLSDTSAVKLLKRSTIKSDEGYMFCNDKRLLMICYPMISMDFHMGLISRVMNPTLLIRTAEFRQHHSLPNTGKVFSVLKKNLKQNLMIADIEGSHNVHMEEPYKLVPIIEKFLHQHYSAL